MKWKNDNIKALETRKQLINSFRYIFRKDISTLNQIEIINRGFTKADMIQDLSDLSCIGRSNIKIVEKYIDSSLIIYAETQSDTLASSLAAANRDKLNKTSAKTFRDKAYSVLRIEVDELRDIGKFICLNKPDRLIGYISAYSVKKSKIRRSVKTQNSSKNNTEQ